MEDHLELAHKLIDAVKALPDVQTWRKEQAGKIAETQKGTWREQKDKAGNPVPKWPLGGPDGCFEYRLIDGSFFTAFVLRCKVTGDEFDLAPGDP